jgi:hypothetical protein
MKEIIFEGIDVKEQLSAKIVGNGEISVSKISTSGMLFETTNQLKINSHCKFQITCGNKKMILSAKVFSVLWKSAVEKDKMRATRYQVAIEFEHLKDNEKVFLDLIVEQILDNIVPLPYDGIRGAKIRIKE